MDAASRVRPPPAHDVRPQRRHPRNRAALRRRDPAWFLVRSPPDSAAKSEVVASELVAILVGSIGLVAAVPLTTSRAALLATRLPPEAGAEAHRH
jgi:hypothetical protein